MTSDDETYFLCRNSTKKTLDWTSGAVYSTTYTVVRFIIVLRSLSACVDSRRTQYEITYENSFRTVLSLSLSLVSNTQGVSLIRDLPKVLN